MEKLTTTTASVGNLNLFTAKTKIYISRISLINIKRERGYIYIFIH